MSRFDDKDAFGIMMLLSVGLGTCMSAPDASVVNTLLPVIREEYHVPVGVIRNVPLGTAAFAIGLRHIPEEQSPPLREETFDRVGAFLFLGAFLALQVALSRGNDWGWLSAPT